MSNIELVPQLVQGVELGSVNCTCAAGAMCVGFATDGRQRPTASEVRALCRDENGLPDTKGGTSLRQVGAAMAKGWNVDLDIHMGMGFDAMWDRLADPDLIGIVQIRYVAFFGQPGLYAMRKRCDISHAVVARRTGATAEVFDSLADGRFDGTPVAPKPVTKPLLRTAAGRLKQNLKVCVTPCCEQDETELVGDGKVNVGFVRAATGAALGTPPRAAQKVRFGDDAFFVYDTSGPTVTRESRRFAQPTSAPAEGPTQIDFNRVAHRVVRITAGVLAGKFVEPGRNEVELLDATGPDTPSFDPIQAPPLVPAAPPDEPPDVANGEVVD